MSYPGGITRLLPHGSHSGQTWVWQSSRSPLQRALGAHWGVLQYQALSILHGKMIHVMEKKILFWLPWRRKKRECCLRQQFSHQQGCLNVKQLCQQAWMSFKHAGIYCLFEQQQTEGQTSKCQHGQVDSVEQINLHPTATRVGSIRRHQGKCRQEPEQLGTTHKETSKGKLHGEPCPGS